jgi:hypothetical protein
LLFFKKSVNFDKTFKMITSSKKGSVADYYFEFLKNLSSNSKIDLISKLTQSLKETKPVSEVSLQSLFGVFESPETADEIIEKLRSSRVFTRTIETL